MTSQDEFLLDITGLLARAGIPFMVTGSVASGVHGEPRATNDVDVVIDATSQQLEQFLRSVPKTYYVSDVAAREALAERSMFNVIAPELGYKADLIFRKAAPFHETEFSRRRSVAAFHDDVPLVTAEGAILSKLEWRKESGSERQFRDVVMVAATSWDRLDFTYLRRWGGELGVSEDLERALAEADRLRPR